MARQMPGSQSTGLTAGRQTAFFRKRYPGRGTMRILVTGGTGTVGSRVAEALLKRGAQVRVMARNRPARLADGVEFAGGDLLDPTATLKALEGVDKMYLLNAVAADELTQGLIAYNLARRC